MRTATGERFSGHESFVCRYGWLPKVFRAVSVNPGLLRHEEAAMLELGIGRNMVKSIQFWGEATAVIQNNSNGGHEPGPVGLRLFADGGWDPYLETLESLWLIHWRLSTTAGLAAWNEVFGEGRQTRFNRQALVDALARRGEGAARPLASSTLEQHAAIFIQSYFQEERSSDDTSWCPLQDLGLLRGFKGEGGLVFNADPAMAVGLTVRVFGIALLEFVLAQGGRDYSVDFLRLLKSPFSPGQVFRLDESQLRLLIESLGETEFKGALTFVDTADTQSIVLKPSRIDPNYRIQTGQGVADYA